MVCVSLLPIEEELRMWWIQQISQPDSWERNRQATLSRIELLCILCYSRGNEILFTVRIQVIL